MNENENNEVQKTNRFTEAGRKMSQRARKLQRWIVPTLVVGGAVVALHVVVNALDNNEVEQED